MMIGIRAGWPALVALLLAAGPVSAQHGLYVGMELGWAVGSKMGVTGTNNDWSTRCDRIINPTGAETGDECATPPPLPLWVNEIGRGYGTLTAFSLGYRWGGFRVEGEYLYRATAYDQRSVTRIGDRVLLEKADQELEIADGGVDDVLSHALFANVLYDFRSRSRYTPYIGVGGGAALVALDYFSRWKRNDDPDAITTFVDPKLKATLAGTTTIAAAKLSDLVPGYQVVAGVNYRVDDRLTFGLNIRWTSFLEFQSEDREWDQLRSHESSIGRGFPILYSVTTEDASFLGIGVRMTYRLR